MSPSPVHLEPMDWDEFDAWAERSVAGFAAQQVAAGLHPEAEAADVARRTFAELLPSGLATPLHLLWTVHEGDACGAVVGHLWLRVRTMPTEAEAFVFDVELVQDARGRGLGRATMLAAEDAARGQGATVMRLNVFGHNTTAIRLYDRLGYAVTSATMTKPLAADEPVREPEPLVELRAMTEQEYADLRPRLQGDLDHLLPDGPATPGHLLRTAYDGSEPAGVVWLALRERSDGRHAFGHDLEVPAQLRGRGYGRAIVQAAVALCRAEDARSVGLSVSGCEAARSLFDAEGFELTAATMAKPL